jgi:adenylate cyclase
VVSGQVDRRLAAILAADVAGYSRLMGVDEIGTFGALKAHRSLAIDPSIASHAGRIVKTTGDGMLVEFSSAIQAVACALDIQKVMTERNRDVPPNRRIEFRIGINIGDIIIDSDDVFGDGVNIAARLESLAEPGSTYLSRAVYEQVTGKIAAASVVGPRSDMTRCRRSIAESCDRCPERCNGLLLSRLRNLAAIDPHANAIAVD